MRARLLFLCTVAALLSFAAPAQADFGPLSGPAGFSAAPSAEGGAPALLAGSHPQALGIEVNFKLSPEGGVPRTEGDLKNLELELPPGLFEDPAAVRQCSQAAFHTPRGKTPFEASLSGESCPDKSQVGTVEVRSSYGGGETRSFGLFNLDPPPGAPSELGLNAYGAPLTLIPHVRQAEGSYGLTLVAQNVSEVNDVYGLRLNLWGVPWAISHDSQRGDCLNEAKPAFGWAKCSVGPAKLNPQVAYLTLPTACEEGLPFTLRATSWQEPQKTISATFNAPGLEDCEGLRFEPVASGVLSNPRASSPSGFDFDLNVDNEGFLSPILRAPSPVKQAIVTLPEGMTINPSVGAGLVACHPGQYEAETVSSAPGAGCPNESKIGDFTVESPLFEEAIEGSTLLRRPASRTPSAR